jgi:uncharacterized integral membrane protein
LSTLAGVAETPEPETPEPSSPGAQPPPADEKPRKGLASRVASEIREGPEQRRYITLALVALLVLYVVGLIVANSKQVRISFVLGSASIDLLWLIILCVALGGVIGWILRGRRESRRAPARQT